MRLLNTNGAYMRESIYTLVSIAHPQEVLINYFDRQN